MQRTVVNRFVGRVSKPTPRAAGKIRATGWKRGLALGVLLIGASAASGCTLEAAEGEPVGEQVQEAVASYFQNLRLVEKNCRRVTVYFDRVTKFNNRPVVRFRLLRGGVVVNTVVPNFDKSSNIQISVGDGWFFPGDGTLHSYVVQVENDLGETQKSSALNHSATTCPALGHDFVIVKLTPSDLAPYSEVSADNKIKGLFGSTSSNKSVTSYFKEASYGKVNLAYVEKPGWLDIGMTHSQFCSGASNINTASDGKKYCADGPAKTVEAIALYSASIASEYPGKKVIWVFNGMSAGGASYNANIRYGALEIAQGDQRGLFHETGHYFDLTDGWGLRCPSSAGWFGPSLTGIPAPTPPSGCYFAAYAYALDPMSAGSGHHFYGIHKYQMGWLRRNLNVVTANALTTGRRTSVTVKAIDDPVLSTSTQFTDIRLARYQLDVSGSSYFTFEYRRNVGMNAVSYPNQPTLNDGIYMTYFPGKNPTTLTPEDDDTSRIYGDVLVPFPESASAEPYITQTSPYIDADRQLRVTLESIDSSTSKATVKIHKAYAYTGTCVTATDNANYVSAGFPCFCSRAIGAFVNKTSTTVECKAGVAPTR